MKFLIKRCFLMILICSSANILADERSQLALMELQTRWAEVNYTLQGEAQIDGFENLVSTAQELVSQYQNDPALWIWSGIIKSTYAGVKGGLGALKFAKASKIDLEKALELDDQALQGSAYTSLGTLFFNVPGWPLGFGNKGKAEIFLKKALEINPDGIDPNYFYGQYLEKQKQFSKAQIYYHKALEAPDRPGRKLADQGRRAELTEALKRINKNLD